MNDKVSSTTPTTPSATPEGSVAVSDDFNQKLEAAVQTSGTNTPSQKQRTGGMTQEEMAAKNEELKIKSMLDQKLQNFNIWFHCGNDYGDLDEDGKLTSNDITYTYLDYCSFK